MSPPEGGFQLLHGQIANFGDTNLALRRSDKIQIFLQTDAGRKAADGNGGEGFSIHVPGTIAISGDSLAEGSALVLHPEIIEAPAYKQEL